jgi:hypothetical protein
MLVNFKFKGREDAKIVFRWGLRKVGRMRCGLNWIRNLSSGGFW